MQYNLDLHCHTVLSGHAYSTLAEIANHAKKVGLTHFGMAEHGPGMPGGAHLFSFLNSRILPEYISGVRLLKGVEANIMDESGKLDLQSYVLEKLDFVIVSLHRCIIKPASKETNTKTLINAMKKNKYMHILGHPGDACYEIDLEAVVKTAAETKTILEINNSSLNPGSYRCQGEDIFIQMLKMCNELNVSVIAGSDSHYHTEVGELSRAKEVIIKSGIKESLVLNTNVDSLLEFIKNKRGK